MTLTDVEVREDYAGDFEVQASARSGGDEPLDAALTVDILADERVIGSGTVFVYFDGEGSAQATFVSFDDYDADFDQVVFLLADPLREGLANLQPVAGTFSSGDFTLTDVWVGKDAVDDFEVRGTATYGGAETVEADLAVVIEGAAGDLGRATTLESFEPGRSRTVEFITSTDHTPEPVTLTFEAMVDAAAPPPTQGPAVVPLPGDRTVDGVTFTSIRLVRDYNADLAADAVAVASDDGSPYDGELQAQVLGAGEVVATITGYATLAPGEPTAVYLSGSDDFTEALDDVRFRLFRR